jgi:ABC-type transporter lipoprotein component MlaA
VNRGIWGANRVVLEGLIHPTSRVYHAVVPGPARTSIRNFNHNILYPGRLVNHALQGRWTDAREDSVRFLTNTTVGVGGLFDVATRWDIPRPRAGFAQTFTRWGWQPGTYIMLPFLGPSDDTHLAGLILDETLEPWNYVDDARLVSYAVTYNELVKSTEDAVRFVRSEADPYASLKYVWTYTSKDAEPDWTVNGPKHRSTLDTLGVATFRPRDPDFVKRGRTGSVTIPSTGSRLRFSLWLREENAPLVYISPGLGSHRLANASIVTAEYLYQQGFSVVSTTSAFHPEFMERASSVAIPAYPPIDSADLLASLTAIDRSLEKRHGNRLGRRALVGFSMGGFQALYLAARETKAEPAQMRFDRYIAINPPVSLRHGIGFLDEAFQAPDAWPAESRQDRIDNSVHKAAKVGTLPPAKLMDPPFDGIESKYLIGLNFRLTLRDIIYSTQKRKDMGLLATPLSPWRRDEAYREIFGISFRDYFTRFIVPFYSTQGIGLQDFAREGDLRTYGRALRSQSKAHVLTNRNDFLLSPEDVSWLGGTFGTSRLRLFPSGGHLGNLNTPPMQEALLRSLEGIK